MKLAPTGGRVTVSADTDFGALSAQAVCACYVRGASLIVEEDLFDRQVEHLGETEGDRKARVELPRFDGVDRLP